MCARRKLFLAYLLLWAVPLGAEDREPPLGTGLQFEKTNRVVLGLGGTGAFDQCQAKYPCVLKVGDEWWMWYNGRAGDCFTGAIGLARSRDGLKWTKANGGETGPPGACDSTKVDHPAVVQFNGRFHMWYTAGDKTSRYTIGYATSADGLNWRRENKGRAVLSTGKKGAFDERSVLHPAVVRDETGRLHLWYNGVGPQQAFHVGYATSEDGLGWTRRNGGKAVLKPGKLEGRAEDYVYNVMVVREAGQFHMWYSSAIGLKMNRHTPRSNAIVYASSRDGVHWERDRQAVMYNGKRGSIDEYSAFACYVVRRPEGFWMYYSAGHLVKARDPRRFRTSLAIHRFQ